jgi:cell division protein FtsI/penicillin-binding protein 2
MGLGVRLVWLQVVQHEEYLLMARQQQTLGRPIQARRGAFLDIEGRPLCVSVPVKSVFVAPCDIDPEEVPRVSLALSSVLEVGEEELRNGMLRSYDSKFMWVKRLVSEREAAILERMKLKGVGTRTEYRRTFPQGVMAPHLIGWVNVDHEGQEGLERVFDAQLSGREGYEQLECDGRRRPLLTDRALFSPVVNGCDIKLTVDAEIQRIAADELDKTVQQSNPVSATVIVMEVKTGRILAMASCPAFNPANPGAVDPKDRLNRAVGACYEPGSIFKPFVMAGYLDARLGAIEDRIFCENGLLRVGARPLRDHHPYGWLTVQEVMEKSSNVGMAKIGMQMGAARLYGIITAWGFGRSTRSGLPGEIDGIMTRFNRWGSYTVTSVPMGQEIATTPMQLITAFNGIANGGVLVKPQVVESITDPDGKVMWEFTGPETQRRVIDSETARTLIDPVLTGVIQRGTGGEAGVGVYPKFGKTGTGQKMAPGGGYSHSRFVSSFLCGSPVDDPRITVLVLVDEPRSGSSYYGGTVAAPAAARIVERTLKYLHVPSAAVARGSAL